MKILIHDYAGHPFQVHLSRQLAQRGHHVTHAFFADDPGPKGVLQTRPGDPPTLRFAGISTGRPYDKAALWSRRVNDRSYGKHAARLIADLRPDIVISGNTPTEAQTFIVRACKAVDAALVHWLQDFYSVAVSKLLGKKFAGAGRLVGAYYRHLERKQLRASDAVVIITDDFRPLASAWAGGDDKVVTIENWGALDDIPLRPKDNAWSREHALSDAFTCLYSGTLGRKNTPGYLATLARACGAADRVVVAGQGVGVEQLETASREGLATLRVLPLQPAARLPDVLATGDVLIALVEADAGSFSVPSKVQSYLCAGRPILMAAPRENLAARIVVRENAGIVVDPHDEAGFVAAALRLQNDPALRAEMGANGRAYAERSYDIVAVADRFEQVLQTAAKRARLPRPARGIDNRQHLGEVETYP